MQDISLTPGNAQNTSVYGTPICVIIYTSYNCQTWSGFYTALNAGRSSREKGVRLSVRLSVKRVDCKKTKGNMSR